MSVISDKVTSCADCNNVDGEYCDTPNEVIRILNYMKNKTIHPRCPFEFRVITDEREVGG